MNTADEYRHKIRDCLLDKTMDWGGMSRIHVMYERAHGRQKAEFVAAVADLLDQESEPVVVANLVDLAFDLNLHELDENVMEIRDRSIYQAIDVGRAVDSYLEFRKVQASSYDSLNLGA